MPSQISDRWKARHHTIRGAAGRHSRLVLLFVSAILAFTILGTPAGAKGPKPFKPFKLKTLDGQKKTLADYAGKATLIAFFYPQCPYCNVAMPAVQKIYDKYKARGLSMVWINVVPDENKMIPKWMEEHDLTAPVLIGASQESLMRDYDLVATPTHFLLGENSAVLLRQDGFKAGDDKLLEAKIATALNATP